MRERQHKRPVLHFILRQLASLSAPRFASPSPGRSSLWLLFLGRKRKEPAAGLPPGVHELRYNVLAADGHFTEEVVRFRVSEPR